MWYFSILLLAVLRKNDLSYIQSLSYGLERLGILEGAPLTHAFK